MAALSDMPDQLVADSTKNTKKWKEANVKALSDMINNQASQGLRKTPEEVSANMRMFNNELSRADMLEVFDPIRVADGEVDQIPEFVKSYNIVRGPIVTIAAEERKRKLEYSAVAINEDVVNQKDTEFKDRLFSYLGELEKNLIEGEYVDESVVQAHLERLQLDKTQNLKSAHEVMANELLQYFQNDPSIRLHHIFAKGFHWMLIAGEVIYRVYGVGKEIRVATVDPRNLYTIGMGGSDFHENAEAWVEREYMTLSQITSEFKLTKSEVKALEDLRDGSGIADMYQETGGRIVKGAFVGEALGGDLNLDQRTPDSDSSQFEFEGDGYFGTEAENEYVDSEGRIRIDRVHWMSKRRIYERELPDDEGIDFVDETYEVPENSGEKLEEVIINELWQGFKIGETLIKDVKPCDMQLRSIDNPAIVRPPYCGAILNYGSNEKAVSLLDDIRSYKEDYDMWANKLRKLWITYQGAVMRIDRARIPENMSTEEWYKWVKVDGISWEDGFRMSPDAAFMAGNMQSQNPIINPSLYNEIIVATQQLDRLESKIEKMAAMPAARSGDLEGNEGLGVSQQAMVTATHRTEDSFILHNYVKTRVLEVMIEMVKYLWEGDTMRKQYLLSDLSQYMLEYDAKLMQESEVSVIVTDGAKMAEFDREIAPIAFSMAQNDRIALSDYSKFRNAPTPSTATLILEKSEAKQDARQAEQAKLQGEEQRKTLEMQEQMQQAAHNRELEIIRVKAEEERKTKYELAQFQLGGSMAQAAMADENGDGVVDDIEIKTAEIAARSAEEIKRMDVESKERINQEQMKVKEEEIKVKRMQANKTK